MTHPLLSNHKTRCSIPYSHDRTILPSPPQQVLLLMDLLCRLLLLFRNFRFVTKGKAVLDNSINALSQLFSTISCLLFLFFKLYWPVCWVCLLMLAGFLFICVLKNLICFRTPQLQQIRRIINSLSQKRKREIFLCES